jgi:glycerol-3-phosphate cytidylyltransferase
MTKFPVAYAPGVFDLFHIGHLNLLRNAKGLCDHLIAGVVTAEVAARNKRIAPAVPLDERLEIVAAIRYVDEAVVEDSLDKMAMWQRLKFDVLVKGDDWKGTEFGDRLERNLATVGVAVAYVPYTTHTSSTLLREVLERALRSGQSAV